MREVLTDFDKGTVLPSNEFYLRFYKNELVLPVEQLVVFFFFPKTFI
jgi:hypothetical protein